jgi:hypothetical protein
MEAAARTSRALELMTRFAERTGLSGSAPRRRYLWTDAFAVCNFFGLADATGKTECRELGLRLVDQVHHELGRHRPDDRRTGWLSGLSGEEAEAHPTRGGLRIGKPLPERGPTEPFDPDLEWERDGQYFHYLTKWAHALDRTARATGRPVIHTWARELVARSHAAFADGPAWDRRTTWKMSIDLSRPLVPSMGQHDPLDGFVTCTALDATATALHFEKVPSLAAAVRDFGQMVEGAVLSTADPLGLGGLLEGALRLVQANAAPSRVVSLLDAALVGLRQYLDAAELSRPAGGRLAFRELGLAIGLAAVPFLQAGSLARTRDARGRAVLAEVAQLVPLRDEIVAFWCDVDHRRTSTWIEHADINDVMLATSLAPEGFLDLDRPSSKPS